MKALTDRPTDRPSKGVTLDRADSATGDRDDIRIVAIAGSLRDRSINRALIEAARDVAPKHVRVDVIDISDIPLYNQDLDNDSKRPRAVETLKALIAESDGLLLATPEYNFGISGVLKNVIDWVSRPAMRSPLLHKPVAIMGASPGALGTARAQENLKTILMSTLAVLFPHPGVVVGNAMEKFDDGRLTDKATRSFLSNYMRDFSTWVRQQSAVQRAA